MKKLILLLFALVILAGCDDGVTEKQCKEYVASSADRNDSTGQEQEESTSLSGTTWKLRSKTPDVMTETDPGTDIYEPKEGEWTDYELTFTSTHSIFTIIGKDGIPHSETDTYTYDPPAVVLTSDNGLESTGTVENDTMKIIIWMTADIYWDLELKKQ
jgi:hypothetical protein